MKKSIIYLKKLTSAEVGETKTHEKYVRLPNDFDYESFFPGLAKENGSVIQVDFIAKNKTIGHSLDQDLVLKFVYYANSNHEKRIPSLGDVFSLNDVGVDDVVCLESCTENGSTCFFISFTKSTKAYLAPSSVTYSIETEDNCTTEVYATTDGPLQQIFYGAPGTGKSFFVDRETEKMPKDRVFRTTFHPDSDYSTFVGAYKPTMREYRKQISRDLSPLELAGILKDYYNNHKDGNIAGIQQFVCDYLPYLNGDVATINTKELLRTAGIAETYAGEITGKYVKILSLVPKHEDRKIEYAFVKQTFLKAYIAAWQDVTQKVALVIEEINRGNCAQIFGDLFQLLDRNILGFSDYPINADDDLRMALKSEFSHFPKPSEDLTSRINSLYGRHYENAIDRIWTGDILALPNNLYIWATMNTSDQSLFPIDSAFKRRWDWQYMPIAQGRDDAGNELKWTIDVNGKKFIWWSFIEKINAQIGEATQSEDKKLGFFFCKANHGVISPETFVGKVIFYLWNDVFKDYGFEGSIFKDADNSELSFNKFYKADLKGNAVVQQDKVELFLNNLGVEFIEDDHEKSEDAYDESADSGKEHKETLVAVTVNGERLTTEGRTQFDLYLDALKHIGIDSAGQAIESMKFTRKGSKMATKNQVDQLVNSDGYSYVQSGEYYFVKGSNGYTLTRILEDLKKALDLDIKIEYK